MKKPYTFLLAAAVFLAAAFLCFSLSNTGEGESIIVQQLDNSVPLRGDIPSTEGYIELLPGETVNINTADIDELMKLPGIGEVIAQRIIDYREAHGSFRNIEEIMKIEDIGEGRFEGIRLLIVTYG